MKESFLKNKSVIRYIAAVTLAFLGAYTLPQMQQFDKEALAYSNSIFSVLLFFLLFWVLERVLDRGFSGKRSRWLLPGILGFVFSSCMSFGSHLDLWGMVPFLDMGMWFGIAVWTVLSTLMIRFFWECLNSRKSKELPCSSNGGLRSWMLRTGAVFGCYFLVFLAVYPGFFVYDAQDELIQVITRSFSAHHPLLHVLLLGGVVQAGYKLTGSYNMGIALYTLLQMLVMAGIYAWGIEKLRKRGMRKDVTVFLTLYFGLFPVLVMFSLCSAKDGVFTGMLFIMVVLLQELCADPETFLKKKSKVAFLILASLGMLLFRHNGFYAFLVFLPFLLWKLKRYFKKVLVLTISILLLYTGINAGLIGVLHADTSENQEILTVPISQLARVYTYERDDLTEDEVMTLYQYLPEYALSNYKAKCTDLVKVYFNNNYFSENKTTFLRLWVKLGLRHPFTYINAWFLTSYGFWYPDTVIDVYEGNTVFTFTYGDSSYFGYEVEQPGERESKIPWLNEVYRRLSLEITQQKIPIVSMLFSPGFLFWVFLFFAGFLCYYKNYDAVIPFLLPFLVWLTVILGPTYLVRYVLFLWALLPFLLWEVFAGKNEPSRAAECEEE